MPSSPSLSSSSSSAAQDKTGLVCPGSPGSLTHYFTASTANSFSNDSNFLNCLSAKWEVLIPTNGVDATGGNLGPDVPDKYVLYDVDRLGRSLLLCGHCFEGEHWQQWNRDYFQYCCRQGFWSRRLVPMHLLRVVGVFRAMCARQILPEVCRRRGARV